MSAAKRLSALATLTAGLLAPVAPAIAQDGAAMPLKDRLALTGSLRAGTWWSNRETDDRRGFTPLSLWLKATPDLGRGFSLQAEGWVAAEAPLRGKAPREELREAYLAWRGEAWDVSVGRRLVVWGRADRINPTDVIGTRDYTLLFSDDDDTRRGSLMATSAYGFGDFVLTGYWLPEARPNVYPIRLPQGLRVRQPARRWAADQFAVRLDRTAGGFDWAVTYFDGIDRDPNARITEMSASAVEVLAVHRRLRQFGADFATNLGATGIRGEFAYAWPSSGSDRQVFERRQFAAMVLGADRNLTEHLNANVQYLFRYVTEDTGFRSIGNPIERQIAIRAARLNNQLRRIQQGATFRIAYTTLNDTLVSELSAGGFFTDQSGAVRPKITYAFSDAIKVIVGADVFFGDSRSFYGQVKTNSTGYAEIRYNF